MNIKMHTCILTLRTFVLNSTNKTRVTHAFAVKVTRRDKMSDFLRRAPLAPAAAAPAGAARNVFTFNRHSRKVRRLTLQELRAIIPSHDSIPGLCEG